jgi:hypothetical protein
MSSVEQFATFAESIGKGQSPFREALAQRISEGENVRHLIYSPAFATAKFHSLASALCVTKRRWLIALREDDGSIKVYESWYERTLLIELTIILLSQSRLC